MLPASYWNLQRLSREKRTSTDILVALPDYWTGPVGQGRTGSVGQEGQGQRAVHSLIPPFPFLSFLAVEAISFQKQPISYSLLINPSSLFSIRPETGEISLTRTLDYESDQRRYLLMVRAGEESGSLSAAAEVRLTGVRGQQPTVLPHLPTSLGELLQGCLL